MRQETGSLLTNGYWLRPAKPAYIVTIPNVGPWGSVMTDMRPNIVSHGSRWIVAPSERARATVSSVPSTANQTNQCAGISSGKNWWS